MFAEHKRLQLSSLCWMLNNCCTSWLYSRWCQCIFRMLLRQRMPFLLLSTLPECCRDSPVKLQNSFSYIYCWRLCM